MNEFIDNLKSINIPITIVQIEMNTYTLDKLLNTIQTPKQIGKVDYLYNITRVPIVINEELNNGETKILYSDGKYSTISTIEPEPVCKKDTSFKMEYECKWI